MARSYGVNLGDTNWIKAIQGAVERVKDDWRVELENEVRNLAHHQLFAKLDRKHDVTAVITL